MDLFLVSRREKWIMRLILIVVAGIWLIPIVTAFVNSLQIDGLMNYYYVLTRDFGGITIVRTIWNSLLIAVGHAFFVTVIASLAGFAFSKIRFFGSEYVYAVVLMCLAVPVILMVIPYFYIFRNIGIYNSLWAVICSEVSLTLPFGVLLFRNSFDSLPNELMESANIDGASIYQQFSKIYFPLAKPAIINLIVLCIMWSFQDYVGPSLFITKIDLTTLTVSINTLLGPYGVNPADRGIYNAALVVMGIPGALVYMLSQNFIKTGLTSGALKD